MAEDKERLTEAIEYWKGGSKTRNRKSKSKASKKKRDKYNSSTEIWADISPTERFVMAKVEGYPWWPARLCTAKDSCIAVSLRELDRALISFVGEHHLHIIRKEDDMHNFTGEVIEDDLSKYSSDTTKKLKEVNISYISITVLNTYRCYVVLFNFTSFLPFAQSIEMTRHILRGRGKWEEIELSGRQNEIIEEEEKKSAS